MVFYANIVIDTSLNLTLDRYLLKNGLIWRSIYELCLYAFRHFRYLCMFFSKLWYFHFIILWSYIIFHIFLLCDDILCKFLMNLNVFIRFYEIYYMFTDFIENRIFVYIFSLKLYLNLNMSLWYSCNHHKLYINEYIWVTLIIIRCIWYPTSSSIGMFIQKKWTLSKFLLKLLYFYMILMKFYNILTYLIYEI